MRFLFNMRCDGKAYAMKHRLVQENQRQCLKTPKVRRDIGEISVVQNLHHSTKRPRRLQQSASRTTAFSIRDDACLLNFATAARPPASC
jgi:hypothetical protein